MKIFVKAPLFKNIDIVLSFENNIQVQWSNIMKQSWVLTGDKKLQYHIDIKYLEVAVNASFHLL